MNSWFRYYHAALDHPKVGKLSDAQFRTWVGVLCVACRGDGALPPIMDLAFSLRLPPKDVAKRVEALIAAGLVDRDGEALRPHNWDLRQFKSDGSTERVKRFRAKQGNVAATADETGKGSEDQTTRNVSVTADETARDAENDRARNVPATVHETGPDSDSDSDSESSSSIRAVSGKDDDDLLVQFKKAAKGNLAPGCANVAPLRQLLSEGCDLSDILSFAKARVSKLKRPLENLGNYWLVPEIRAWSRDRRAAAEVAAKQGHAPAREPQTFVAESSPDWPHAVEAWRRERHKKIGPPTTEQRGVRGWHFSAAMLASGEGAKPMEAAE